MFFQSFYTLLIYLHFTSSSLSLLFLFHKNENKNILMLNSVIGNLVSFQETKNPSFFVFKVEAQALNFLFFYLE